MGEHHFKQKDGTRDKSGTNFNCKGRAALGRTVGVRSDVTDGRIKCNYTYSFMHEKEENVTFIKILYLENRFTGD